MRRAARPAPLQRPRRRLQPAADRDADAHRRVDSRPRRHLSHARVAREVPLFLKMTDERADACGRRTPGTARAVRPPRRFRLGPLFVAADPPGG
ncbi:MAG: hypothetical protein AVDCRST_MAG19-2758 [uncultured Thermomicrobiales bacterium]|uniref:Uncharacterized protein n=1 Tax=uncultured Thermomicrobiales bacterium TaxID=1645740 RepID=A0A6J4VBE6_9BACT|nr:MAG: hypothetical protein AVDCRST_MAG19-2758 [uncultured Thermomicrobiales bacterium]